MPRRTAVQRERNKATISELSLKGWTQTRIADYLEVDQAVVNRELKRIKAEWKAEALVNWLPLTASPDTSNCNCV